MVRRFPKQQPCQAPRTCRIFPISPARAACPRARLAQKSPACGPLCASARRALCKARSRQIRDCPRWRARDYAGGETQPSRSIGPASRASLRNAAWLSVVTCEWPDSDGAVRLGLYSGTCCLAEGSGLAPGIGQGTSGKVRPAEGEGPGRSRDEQVRVLLDAWVARSRLSPRSAPRRRPDEPPSHALWPERAKVNGCSSISVSYTHLTLPTKA